MPELLVGGYPWVLLCGWLAVVGFAVWRGSRSFAAFAGVMLGVHSLLSVALWPQQAAAGLGWAVVLLQVAAFVHVVSLMWPRLRPLWWRVLVSWPGQWLVAGSFLALPWAIAAGLSVPLPGWWVPFVLALGGLWQSLRTRETELDLVLDGVPVPGLSRRALGDGRVARPLRVVQISDPHLGPFMSVARLRKVAERAVALEPDLILLTGDYLTMESKGTPGCLAEALAPLAQMEGRVFACRGNHDLEAPEQVARELAAVGVELLIDDAVVVDTPAGPVQVVGADFRWRERAEHLQTLLSAHPRPSADTLRVLLLHDPGAFRHLPDDCVDLTLSGHTHGGHVGLLSLGMKLTAIGALSSVPDHGFWSRGTDRLYVHRTTGHYGFPLRVGVPSEEGLMRVHWTGRPAV